MNWPWILVRRTHLTGVSKRQIPGGHHPNLAAPFLDGTSVSLPDQAQPWAYTRCSISTE